MINIMILAVFSAVTMFFVYCIAISAHFAKRSAELNDSACVIGAFRTIIFSVFIISALWLQAAYFYFN